MKSYMVNYRFKITSRSISCLKHHFPDRKAIHSYKTAYIIVTYYISGRITVIY